MSDTHGIRDIEDVRAQMQANFALKTCDGCNKKFPRLEQWGMCKGCWQMAALEEEYERFKAGHFDFLTDDDDETYQEALMNELTGNTSGSTDKYDVQEMDAINVDLADIPEIDFSAATPPDSPDNDETAEIFITDNDDELATDEMPGIPPSDESPEPVSEPPIIVPEAAIVADPEQIETTASPDDETVEIVITDHDDDRITDEMPGIPPSDEPPVPEITDTPTEASALTVVQKPAQPGPETIIRQEARKFYDLQNEATALKDQLTAIEQRQRDILMQTPEGRALLVEQAEVAAQRTTVNRTVKETEAFLRELLDTQATVMSNRGDDPHGRTLHPFIDIQHKTSVVIDNPVSLVAFLIENKRYDLVNIKTHGQLDYFRSLDAVNEGDGFHLEAGYLVKFDNISKWFLLPEDDQPDTAA